jgi:hypothetical protein
MDHSDFVAAQPMNEQVVIAEREKNFDITGVGCLLQALGLLAPIILSIPLGFIGGGIGMALLPILLLVGTSKSTKWICGSCKNPLASKEMSLCDTCGAHLK